MKITTATNTLVSILTEDFAAQDEATQAAG
jgi:hypothetical protein